MPAFHPKPAPVLRSLLSQSPCPFPGTREQVRVLGSFRGAGEGGTLLAARLSTSLSVLGCLLGGCLGGPSEGRRGRLWPRPSLG